MTSWRTVSPRLPTSENLSSLFGDLLLYLVNLVTFSEILKVCLRNIIFCLNEKGAYATWTYDNIEDPHYCEYTPFKFAFVLLILKWVLAPIILCLECFLCCGLFYVLLSTANKDGPTPRVWTWTSGILTMEILLILSFCSSTFVKKKSFLWYSCRAVVLLGQSF